jgi:hypothetical protein
MNRTISLPEELLKRAEELAAREHVPVEEFLSAKAVGAALRSGVSEAAGGSRQRREVSCGAGPSSRRGTRGERPVLRTRSPAQTA